MKFRETDVASDEAAGFGRVVGAFDEDAAIGEEGQFVGGDEEADQVGVGVDVAQPGGAQAGGEGGEGQPAVEPHLDGGAATELGGLQARPVPRRARSR